MNPDYTPTWIMQTHTGYVSKKCALINISVCVYYFQLVSWGAFCYPHLLSCSFFFLSSFFFLFLFWAALLQWGTLQFSFTWWGCCGVCLWHNQTSLPTPFYSVLVSVSVLTAPSTVFHSINSPNHSPLSQSVLPVLFLPKSVIGPFNYISLCESLHQPWYNPLWLTGLKAPTNELTNFTAPIFLWTAAI